MADPQVAPGTAPAQADTPDRKIPSFSQVADESRDARASELAELAGVKPGGKDSSVPKGDVSAAAAAGAPADAFDFDAEYGKLPEPLRNGIVERFTAQYNDALGREYGDILPLVAEVRTNPNLRATLAAAAQDPELRDYLADPDARKQIKQLSKKELREFLFGEATATYEKYAAPAAAAPGGETIDPRDARIAQLEERFTTEQDTREQNTYISSRQNEMRALTSAFPDLAQNVKQLEHVVNHAESQFERAALRSGIDVSKVGWVAKAMRAGVKPPSYREAHEYYAEMLGRSTPPAAPATSPATPPAPPQAPRDGAEGKNRALQLLKTSGGLKGLATTSRRK